MLALSLLLPDGPHAPAEMLIPLEATYRLTITASHIPGNMNILADDLSHNNIISFFLQAPYMHKTLVPIPLMALDLLLDPKLDWTSRFWMVLFKATVGFE